MHFDVLPHSLPLVPSDHDRSIEIQKLQVWVPQNFPTHIFVSGHHFGVFVIVCFSWCLSRRHCQNGCETTTTSNPHNNHKPTKIGFQKPLHLTDQKVFPKKRNQLFGWINGWWTLQDCLPSPDQPATQIRPLQIVALAFTLLHHFLHERFSNWLLHLRLSRQAKKPESVDASVQTDVTGFYAVNS